MPENVNVNFKLEDFHFLWEIPGDEIQVNSYLNFSHVDYMTTFNKRCRKRSRLISRLGKQMLTVLLKALIMTSSLLTTEKKNTEKKKVRSMGSATSSYHNSKPSSRRYTCGGWETSVLSWITGSRKGYTFLLSAPNPWRKHKYSACQYILRIEFKGPRSATQTLPIRLKALKATH